MTCTGLGGRPAMKEKTVQRNEDPPGPCNEMKVPAQHPPPGEFHTPTPGSLDDTQTCGPPGCNERRWLFSAAGLPSFWNVCGMSSPMGRSANALGNAGAGTTGTFLQWARSQGI